LVDVFAALAAPFTPHTGARYPPVISHNSTPKNPESSVDNKPQQTTTAAQSADGKRAHRIEILRVSDPIKIDGRLDEPEWSQAEAATDFRQESPIEGAPASEKTEVRVLYDNKNIYIGIRAFDSEPSKINARDLVRD